MEKINLLNAFKQVEEQIIETIGVKSFDLKELNNYLVGNQNLKAIYQENGELWIEFNNDFDRDMKLESLSIKNVHYIHNYVVNNELPVY